MTTFVALLRGVNVGKAKRVPMADLRSLLCGLGYDKVATLLNSGNAVFSAAKGTPKSHAESIGSAISGQLGIAVPVVVKSAKELSAIVSENTLAAAAEDPSRLLVAFVQDVGALSALAPVGLLVEPPEKFLMGRNAAYLLCARGILDSQAGAALLGKAGRSATSRNWATVLKLQALARERDA
jgi:uncharacterized protein (DUF1697 family)